MILKYIDYVLDRVTMYRLILYYLIAILLVALGLSAGGLLPYTFLGICESTGVLLLVSMVTNKIFSSVFDAPTNVESVYITALILACIISPIQSSHDIPLLIWAAVLAMASKYILAIRKKHLFNPVAIAVVLTAFWLNQSATWWVGTQYMLPVVILGGLLMVRKMRRSDMVYSFFMSSVITVGVFSILGGHNLLAAMKELLLLSPLFFFAFVMLTEPLTSPATVSLQVIYGVIVGFLFAPQVHFGSLYFTPELALLVGNIFTYSAGPKIKERLVLVNRLQLTEDVIEFDFKPLQRFAFSPGQYMEFTLPHKGSDSRGNRRYFTVASSPTEDLVKLGVKFYPEGSSFKKEMEKLNPEQTLMTGQLAGDFTLPKDQTKKLVFVAGGIGITPFRSMLKYLADTGEQRDVVLVFMNKGPEEVVYQDVFDEAAAKIGLKTVHTFTATMPQGWKGRTGRIDQKMIQEEVPDFAERLFYISGPHAMVVGVEDALSALGVPQNQIKKDFFPGLT